MFVIYWRQIGMGKITSSVVIYFKYPTLNNHSGKNSSAQGFIFRLWINEWTNEKLKFNKINVISRERLRYTRRKFYIFFLNYVNETKDKFAKNFSEIIFFLNILSGKVWSVYLYQLFFAFVYTCLQDKRNGSFLQTSIQLPETKFPLRMCDNC